MLCLPFLYICIKLCVCVGVLPACWSAINLLPSIQIRVVALARHGCNRDVSSALAVNGADGILMKSRSPLL